MKKNIVFKISISAAVVLVVFSMIISSCNFKFGDSSLLTEPTVDYSSTTLTLSIPMQSKSTKYINIYRQTVTTLKSKNYDEADIDCIGMIFPQNLTSGGSTYQFQDSMVIKGEKYRYQVRYCESKGYYYSEWSNAVSIPDKEGTSGYDSSLSEEDLTYSVDDVSFEYDETDYTLTIHGDIKVPSAIDNFAEDFVPGLLVKIIDEQTKETTSAKVFMLPNSVLTGIAAGTTEGRKFSLKGILSSDFFDTDITIAGIVGQLNQLAPEDDNSTSQTSQKSAREAEAEDDSTTTSATTTTSTTTTTDDEESEKKIMRIIWTKPAYISVLGHADNVVNISEGISTDAFDFSHRAK